MEGNDELIRLLRRLERKINNEQHDRQNVRTDIVQSTCVQYCI